MIIGIHALLYAPEVERAEAFVRDVLGFSSVDTGAGGSLFPMPATELGVQPTDGEARQELYLMCDDLDATIAELTARGVELAGPPAETGAGRLVSLRVPGGGELGLYEPSHRLAIRPGPPT
jgi:predicted enzyme related to lactoylglutathione lyase